LEEPNIWKIYTPIPQGSCDAGSMTNASSELFDAVADDDARRLTELLSTLRPDPRDETRATPLHWAARRGYLDCVQALISAGAEIDARDDKGRTPLYMATASTRNTGEMIMVLRGAGADPFARTKIGGSPFDLAHIGASAVAATYGDLPEPLEDGQLPQLVPNILCFAMRSLFSRAERVGAMDRMEDGAWFFSLGTETQQELDDHTNLAPYSLQEVAALDPSIIDYIREPPGTRLVRDVAGGFVPG
jgi:hypothetical protein